MRLMYFVPHRGWFDADTDTGAIEDATGYGLLGDCGRFLGYYPNRAKAEADRAAVLRIKAVREGQS